MEIKIYKIYDTERKLFFKGGWFNGDSRYGKQGKTWNQINHVKSCLKGHIETHWREDGKFVRGWRNNIPETWEVIEFSSVTGERRFKAKDLYPPTNE